MVGHVTGGGPRIASRAEVVAHLRDMLERASDAQLSGMLCILDAMQSTGSDKPSRLEPDEFELLAFAANLALVRNVLTLMTEIERRACLRSLKTDEPGWFEGI